jgi:hypothetical protein
VKGKRGNALILDAMMFLTVAAIVSVSLVAFSSPTDADEGGLQDLVDGVHEVLLRTTISFDQDDHGLSVNELVIAYSLQQIRNNVSDLMEDSIMKVEEIIHSLLPIGIHHSWSFGFDHTLVSVGEPVERVSEIWVSERHGLLPVLDRPLIISLKIWR